MINLTEKEFLDYLEKFANKEITKTELAKELDTDFRTLNNKIIEISVTNPDLYYRVITNNEYKQKSRTDIDYEALVIYIIKNHITVLEATEQFNISRRTINRRVNDLKHTNPELYELFKLSVTTGKERERLKNPEIQEKIDKLQFKDVIIGEINEDREKFLLSIEKRINELVSTGMSKKKAAIEMGYTIQYVDKLLNELYRLKIEKNVKQQAKSTNEFRGNLSDMSQYSNEPVENNNKSIVTKKIENRNNEAR